MVSDVGALAQAVRKGDFGAMMPLLDALHEAGDWRERRFCDLVGRCLTLGTRGVGGVQLEAEVVALFWPELPDRKELFAAMEKSDRRPPPTLQGSGTYLPDLSYRPYARADLDV